jgi:hypothetical protein
MGNERKKHRKEQKKPKKQKTAGFEPEGVPV